MYTQNERIRPINIEDEMKTSYISMQCRLLSNGRCLMCAMV